MSLEKIFRSAGVRIALKRSRYINRLAFILIKKKEDPDPFYTTLKSPLSVNEGIRGSRPKAEGRVGSRNRYGCVSHTPKPARIGMALVQADTPEFGENSEVCQLPFQHIKNGFRLLRSDIFEV